MECKLVFRRGLALLLVLALLACACPIRQDAAALIGIDDLAIVAAVLSALGISLVIYGAANNGLDGLGAKLDEYGATLGMAAGEFASSIVGQTSVRGPRILQVAKAGWQALKGFINWLKTEEGGSLTQTTPIHGGVALPSIEYKGYVYPVLITGVTALGSQNTSLSVSDGFIVQCSLTGTQTYEIPYDDENINVIIRKEGYTGIPYPMMALSSKKTGNITVSMNQGAIIGYLAYLYNPNAHYLYLAQTDNIRNVYKTIANTRTYVGNLQLTESSSEWQINDDNLDLSYLTDAVSDIYIRLGSIAGELDTLSDIAQGVIDAYDSSYAATGEGTITATATTADIGAAGDYATPALSSFFPFCIPFDIYAMVTAFAAEPVAPVIEIPFEFTLPGQNQTLAEQNEDNTLVVDLSEFDAAAQVLRSLEYVLFCIGLALLTRKVIKW